jgi:hypothetical protein
MNYSLLIITAAVLFQCNTASTVKKPSNTPVSSPNPTTTPILATVADIPLPPGYEHTTLTEGSFGSFLRKQKLKKDKTVYLYNGQQKANQSVQYAVLDVSTGTRDLQQCADAVMRLRAEYLKEQNQSICFADNDGKQYCWANYKNRSWQAYLETVFGMCGTLSLEKQLKKKQWKELEPGDVVIKGGSPGHAVLVADIAVNRQTGEKLFLLVQSYMPAQDIHVLLNVKENNISPWYRIPSGAEFNTPEWTFSANQLRGW